MSQISDRLANLSPEQLALLSKRLKEKGKPASTKRVIIRREEVNGCPLSFAQQRLWFFQQFEPDSFVYTCPAAVRLTGILNVMALEQALTEIVRRHESLRTSFPAPSGEPEQQIAAPSRASLPLIDLAVLSASGQSRQVKGLAQEESQRTFDLATGPLLRVKLLRLTSDEHVVLLTMHHIISDGWSMGVLVRELGALYQTFSAGQPSPLAELAVQYADYAVWQREWLRGEELEKQLAYWRKQLGGELPILELPISRGRAVVQSYRGETVGVELSERLSGALRQLSKRNGATLFMTLLTSWQVFLSRYAGQDDVIVGTPLAGRHLLETEGLIGFFVNTLAMRADLSGNPSFRQLLGRVKESMLGAYAHQDVPFDKLVEELQPERSMSYEPIFQVMFTLENKAQEVFEMPGLKLSGVEADSDVAKFDLTLILQEQESTIAGVLEYNTDLFEKSVIERLLTHFQVLLESIVNDPEQRISELKLLTRAEEQQLLVEWNQTQADYPRDRCVHELFEEQVARTPDAVAVVYEAEQLTYEELNRRANQVARYLRSMGVGTETLVGICVERSPQMVVGLLGILKAGGAYVPLDPAYPRERLLFMVEDSNSTVVIVEEKLREMLAGIGGGVRTVCLDSEWGEIEKESGTALKREHRGGDELAYVIYTSGSTGTPKGVAVPHRAINRLLVNTDYMKLTAHDGIAQAASSSFDAATFEIWGPLLHGGRIVGVTKEVSLSPSDFAAQIVEQDISGIFLTTALFNQMACHAAWGFRSVQDLLFGGENVDPRWVREVLANAPPKRLLHVYGPTETTTFATWHLVQDVQPEDTTIPIGRPIANTELYVLDEHLQPLPVGMPGQLYIGGDGLARGYLNRPAQTAEKFGPHPFGVEGARLYRTGDLVRYLPDGNIEFMRRVDHQVKLRGFRIELGEIEIALTQHEAVRECTVIVREDVEGDKRLVAYLVGKNGQELTAGELRGYLKQRLPEYMMPSAYVVLGQLPLTPNGKVDRRALPAPEQSQLEAAGGFVEPRTPLEEVLANIWGEVLRLERVGVESNFFELGVIRCWRRR